MRWLPIILLLLLAGPVLAADPECATDPGLTDWACYDGSCRFCTPSVLSVADGVAAATVGCTVIVASNAIFSVSNAEAASVVTVDHRLEGTFDCSIRCQDDLGATSEVRPNFCRFSQSSRPQDRGLAPAFILP